MGPIAHLDACPADSTAHEGHWTVPRTRRSPPTRAIQQASRAGAVHARSGLHAVRLIPHSGGVAHSYTRVVHLDDYLITDATDLAALVADKQVTPVELLALARQRADQVNPKIDAIVWMLEDVADARAAEPLRGPFAGVPFLVKDLAQEYAGFPTTNGSRAGGRRGR